MSTRRLIALALICGMAILLAGGVQLFLLARDTDEDTAGVLVEPGVAAPLDGVTATAQSLQRDGSTVVLDVTLTVPDGAPALDGAEEGWGLLRADSGALVDRLDGEGTCADVAVEPGATVPCTVVFEPEPGDAEFVAVYVREGRSASWPLTAAGTA